MEREPGDAWPQRYGLTSDCGLRPSALPGPFLPLPRQCAAHAGHAADVNTLLLLSDTSFPRKSKHRVAHGDKDDHPQQHRSQGRAVTRSYTAQC